MKNIKKALIYRIVLAAAMFCLAGLIFMPVNAQAAKKAKSTPKFETSNYKTFVMDPGSSYVATINILNTLPQKDRVVSLKVSKTGLLNDLGSYSAYSSLTGTTNLGLKFKPVKAGTTTITAVVKDSKNKLYTLKCKVKVYPTPNPFKAIYVDGKNIYRSTKSTQIRYSTQKNKLTVKAVLKSGYTFDATMYRADLGKFKKFKNGGTVKFNREAWIRIDVKKGDMVYKYAIDVN